MFTYSYNRVSRLVQVDGAVSNAYIVSMLAILSFTIRDSMRPCCCSSKNGIPFDYCVESCSFVIPNIGDNVSR